MINFYYETKVDEIDEEKITAWIYKVIESENRVIGEINYIFCDDQYLLKINQDFLNHDTYTDIITFDNSIGKQLNADIFVSDERVAENASSFKVSKGNEMRRVLVHGVLHLCGYKDKTNEEEELMRQKEDEKLAMFHVEHS